MSKLYFDNCADYDSATIVFYDASHDSIFRAHKKGGFAKRITTCSDGGTSDGALYSSIHVIDNKLILLPRLADSIFVYNILLDKKSEIKLNIEDWGNNFAQERGKLLTGITVNNYLFAIGEWSTIILKINMDDEIIESSINLSDLLDVPREKRSVCFRAAIQFDNKIMLPAYGSNQVFIISPKDLSVSVKTIEGMSGGISSIVKTDRNHIAVSSKLTGRIVVVDDMFNVVAEFSDYPIGFHTNTKTNNIAKLINYNNGILAVPYFANEFLYIDKNRLITDDIAINNYVDKFKDDNGVKIPFVHEYNDGFLAFVNPSREYIWVDNNMNIMPCGYQWFDEDIFHESKEMTVLDDSLEILYDLRHFVDYITNVKE